MFTLTKYIYKLQQYPTLLSHIFGLHFIQNEDGVGCSCCCNHGGGNGGSGGGRGGKLWCEPATRCMWNATKRRRNDIGKMLWRLNKTVTMHMWLPRKTWLARYHQNMWFLWCPISTLSLNCYCVCINYSRVCIPKEDAFWFDMSLDYQMFYVIYVFALEYI